MRIASCSLGCSASNTTGNQIQCGVTDVYVNQEIRITFSQPVDINSISNNSFQMVELGSGRTPPGSFRVDPVDARVLIYRPQLTFDSTGNPIFGLTQGKTYQLLIPGTALDTLGPFVRSTSGSLNTTRMSCTLLASRGIYDPTPGNPRHTMTVTLADVTSYNANHFPTVLIPNRDARGAIDVFRDTNVTINFDDVMNPATLVNPVTKRSSTITVFVDPDGNTADATDQVPVGGEFTITINQNSLTTTVIFVPGGGFPSAGSDPMNRRKIVVNLSSSIADLGGNRLVQPGNTVFQIEAIPFTKIGLVETFDTATLQDSVRSGSEWGGGMLGTGPGGGSGRLGDLVIKAGSIVTMSTDSEDFSSEELVKPEVFNKQNVIDIGDPDTFTVDGGVFEFARILIESGSVLRLEGANPARLLARGEFIVQGTIDVSGGSATIQNPNTYDGGVAGPPGPGGGQGGVGGARPDGGSFVALDPTNDNPNDPGPIDTTNPADYALVNGQPGVGIAFPSLLSMMPSEVAFGRGGLAWPQPGALPPPYDTIRFPNDVDDALTFPYEPSFNCVINTLGGVGSGGGYGLSGFTGTTTFIPPIFGDLVLPPAAAGGDSTDLAITPSVRSLDPVLGYLRGGSGGGGGGGHLFQTRVNGRVLSDCTLPAVPGPLQIVYFGPSSGAGGGSGGGGIQLQAGRRLVSNGVINASGGNGGGSSAILSAQPGGGASGGAVLMQSPQVLIASIRGRVNVSGGRGGLGLIAAGRAAGGDGGPGLWRIESFAPFPDIDTEKIKVEPAEEDLVAQYGPGASIDDVLSVGEWGPSVSGAGAQSGVQSCWFSERDVVDPANPDEEVSNFFRLIFAPDGAELGWDMNLRLAGFALPQSYRGDSTFMPGQTLQEIFGNELGMSPVVVRFQGVHTSRALTQPCSVTLTGINSPIVQGSLTPWVEHPSELTNYFGDPSLTPNAFRIAVVWDASNSLFGLIEGIEDLTIGVTPD